jgi:RNase P/RNase MRP subunit POP5
MTGTKKNSNIVSKITGGKGSKQKILMPTLKEQQRYLVYKIITNKPIKNFESYHNDIIEQCNAMLGLFDGGKAGLLSAKFNPEKKSGIIRVNNKYVDKFKLCLGMVKNIDDNELIVDCIYVSGMLNKAIDKMNC